VAQVKYTRNVMNVNGSWNTSHCVNQPDCICPIVTRSMVPAISTGTTMHMPSGTS
jgi:hypothetical protein